MAQSVPVEAELVAAAAVAESALKPYSGVGLSIVEIVVERRADFAVAAVMEPEVVRRTTKEEEL